VDALAAARRDGVILAAARALGGGRAVLERTVDHVRTRHQFGVSIGTFQAVQHQLSDVATALDAAGLAVARAAWSVQTGLDAAEAVAVAALAATEAFASATLVAHQLHGGMGFVLDSPLHLWSARAVSDPTAPRARRDLLDALADAVGIRAEGIRVAPQHHQPA
jgi:alkylation response protein AidB-like acyl-CoA dehydrogenase